MDYKNIRIVFMGTPEFAVASLQALHEAGCQIVGVITAPDKPGGRGMQLQQSAVKQYAVANGLLVLQPEKLKSPEFVEQLRALKADLQIVVAFRMLPEVVWNMPPMGTVNVHGSLLPQYRGAAPINWAVINGEPFTGVTTFKLKHEIDTGDILLQEKIMITAEDNAGTVHDNMKEIGAQLLLTTIKELSAGTLSPQTQDDKLISSNGQLKHAPKIFTETCEINWHQPGTKIINLIRGLSPFPTAFTVLNGKRLKIFRASYKPAAISETQLGIAESDGKSFLCYTCMDGYIYVSDLQLEGKKRMHTEDFLRGYKWNQNQ
jgi:methionyl-tRNA formyltransferase